MFTILYADDEPDLLEIGRMFLEGDGRFRVETAISASEALGRMAAGTYDAIISDYQMPEMNGIEFLKQVRAAGNGVPFIIFTGRGREEIVIQALNEGADFYLQKGGEPLSQFAELGHKLQMAIQQRQAEASVRDLERREADIINFLPDATLAIDTQGIIIAWNRAMEKMTGVRASQVLGKGIFEYSLPFYHERRPILIDLVLRNDPSAAARYPYIKRDGKTLFSEMVIPHFNDGRGATLWFTASPLYDRQGSIIGAIESFREITEWKKTKTALSESEEKYRAVFETTGTAMVLIESDATISLANSEFERLSGFKKEEIETRKKWTEFVDREDRDRMLAQHSLRRQNRKDALTHYEFRFRSRSGELHHIYLTIDIIPGTTRSVASLLDISERKKMEDSLLAANQEYKSLLSQIQDVYYRTDAQGRLVQASQSWATLLGYDDLSECLGRDIAGDFYYNPQDRNLFLELITRDGKVTEYEVYLRRKDGTPVIVATNSHLYRDSSGNVLGVEGTFRDITGKKEQEKILRSQLALGLALQASHTLEETLDICLNSAIEISGMDSGGIYLISNESGSIDLATSANLGDDFTKLVSHYSFGSANAQIVMAGRPVYTQYSRTGLIHTDVQKQEGLRGQGIVPILFENKVISCLVVASHALDEIPGPARIALETIATQIGAAIGWIRAEEERARSEQRYRNIVEDQTEFISRFRPDGTHVFVNKAYCRYFGMSRKEILGHRFKPEIPAEDLELVTRFFSTLTPDHPVYTIVHRVILPDGRVRWQRWSDRAIFDSSGNVTEYQSVGRDITDMKAAELSLQAAYDEIARSKEELQGQFEEIVKSEHKLRESETKFRAIIDQSFHFIGLMSPDGTLLEANRTALSFSGISRSDAINRPFWETKWWSHSGELRDTLRDAIRRAAQGETVRFEATHKAADGHCAFIDFSVKPVLDSAGKIIYLIPEGRDITDLKNTEETLRRKTASLDNRNRVIETLLDTVPIGIFMVEAPSGKPLIANHEATRLLGRGILPGATGENLSEVYEANKIGTAGPYPAEEMPIVRGINGESSHIDDMVVVRPDGTRVRLEVFGNPVTDSQGRVIASLVSFLDITGRKKMEEALKAVQEKFSKAFISVPDAITISELETGRFVEVNDAATEFFGYSREELIGKTSTELGIWRSKKTRDALIEQLEKRGRVREYLVQEKKRTGEEYSAQINADTLVIGGRKYLITVIHDITERMRAEQVIKEANRKINLLTSITRHDVANQVSLLKGYARIALMENPGPAVSGFLEKIDTAGSTIAKQIEFTRMYQDLGLQAPAWYRIPDLMGKFVPEGVAVACTCDAEVFADPMLERVFYNLIDNALRHGETVKTIMVSCRKVPEGLIISVGDDGIGIPAGLKEKIFEKGFGKHTGFGLFLAREILSITGITITEAGEPGTGARFEMTVPPGGYRYP